MKNTVVIGILGPVLDHARNSRRWERWRPSVALCWQENLPVRRFDLIYQREFTGLMRKIAEDARSVSPDTEIVSHEVMLNDPWDFQEVYEMLHDFAKNYPFDTDNEDYLIHITTGTHVAQICMFLLTESRHFPAKLLQTGPAPDRAQCPQGRYTIIDLDLSRYDRIAMRFQEERRDDISFLKSGIETRNAAFNRLMERIEQVAMNSVDPILLGGPTGAGKSRLARRIYELKRARRQFNGQLVEVNCATLRGDAAMSALFGHKKGAFTGATADRDGLLRAADQGMLFLDEVGELGLDEQSMLLRAIEEKRFLPVGADHEVSSAFQLICGTNRNLSEDAAAGRFRDDLLARINLWTFRLPGLRDRSEDIEPNLDYEMERFAERTGRRVSFNREARNRFLDFAVSPEALWAGNFRDLNGAVTRMSTLASGGRITPEGVAEEIGRLRSEWRERVPESAQDDLPILTEMIGEKAAEMDLFDRMQLAGVIRICRRHNTLSEAGRSLFSVSRAGKKTANDADRLRKYLAKFSLDWKKVCCKTIS